MPHTYYPRSARYREALRSSNSVSENLIRRKPARVTTPDGRSLLTLPSFSSASDYAEVPAGIFALQLRPAGADEAVLIIPGISLAQGETYTAFAGTPRRRVRSTS